MDNEMPVEFYFYYNLNNNKIFFFKLMNGFEASK